MTREGLGWSQGTNHGPHRTLGLGAARLREAAPSSTDGWGGRRHTSTEVSWQEAWPPEKVRFISGAKGQAWEITAFLAFGAKEQPASRAAGPGTHTTRPLRPPNSRRPCHRKDGETGANRTTSSPAFLGSRCSNHQDPEW